MKYDDTTGMKLILSSTILNLFAFFFFSFLQSVYRGYTMRKKRWGPEMERRIKDMLNCAKTAVEATKYLQQYGFEANDIRLIVQRFYGTPIPIPTKSHFNDMELDDIHREQRTPLSAHEQQLELIGLSQNVC